MRHIEIKTCEWLSPEWRALIAQGYHTELVTDERIAVMWKGSAARDYAHNVIAPLMYGDA